MQDNSDLQAKIMLRSRFIDRLPQGFTVVDFFAGEGVLAQTFWLHNAGRVICVEKDASKAAAVTAPMIDVIVADNRSVIDLAAGADVIDCDAYGLVMPFIRLLAGAGCSGKRVFFTDGTPHKARRVVSAHRDFKRDCGELMTDLELVLNKDAGVYYGTGVIK